MAKCGCSSSTCNCVVQAGDNIAVSGAGTMASPYVISADEGDAVTVADTPTVDMTQVGTVISSAVKIDPVAGNTLTATANGLLVSCESIQDCVGAALDDGLIYDDAANQMRVRISTDVGNTAVFGGDSGVFVPASGGGFTCAALAACPIDALQDVNMTTTPPAANQLMRFDGAQWVPLPVGCGLTVTAAGINLDTTAYATLTRKTANDNFEDGGTAPLAGACDVQGMPLYCDSAGNLRTKPEKFVDTTAAAINEAIPSAPIPFQTTDITATIVNPSACYAMCGIIHLSAILYESSTGNSNPQTFFSFDLDNGAGFQEFGVRMRDTRGIASVSQERTRFSAPLSVCLDPGETKNIVFRVRWDQGPVAAGGTTQILAAAREIRWLGTNI